MNILLIFMVGAIITGVQGVPTTNLLPPPQGITQGLAMITTPQGATIYAEVADTPEKRERGLMFRTSLAPDHGMLFTFTDYGLWTFWMKNTKIPLDLIWMDPKGLIVHIEHNVPVCIRQDDFCPRYTPRKKATAVLEILGGQAKKLHLQKGMSLHIDLP